MKNILLLTICLILGLNAAGCVSRELYITSEPDGASVLINDTYKGTTPMTHKFVHYQVFGLRLEKEGYHPIYAEEKIAAPLYEKPGIDFISEALIPKKIHDRRELHYKLEKIEGVDDLESVLKNADKMRQKVGKLAEKSKIEEKEREHLKLPLPLKEGAREAEEKKKKAAEPKKEEAENKTPEK
ncbi:MAG: PEGA domain-containing protein [Planctomycetota bacterium]|jgi:hypothetical protein